MQAFVAILSCLDILLVDKCFGQMTVMLLWLWYSKYDFPQTRKALREKADGVLEATTRQPCYTIGKNG